MSNNFNDKEVLLKVEHLSQYFKLGQSTLKAVNDVSFDIKKGEVFGLVGESGCGKTTTGRSIIKLYNCTDGNVYFEGRRICAGTLTYKNAIKDAWKKFFKNFSKTHQNKIYLQERLPISITVRESFCSYFYYASFSFARAASVAKPSLSFTASSASIFLLISTFASFNPCMNLL